MKPSMNRKDPRPADDPKEPRIEEPPAPVEDDEYEDDIREPPQPEKPVRTSSKATNIDAEFSDPRIAPQPVPPEKRGLNPAIDANARGKKDAPPVKQGGLSEKEARRMGPALVFLGVAILVLIAVLAFGTWKMPESGNEATPADAVGPPVSSD
jgi:hypothetical protein